MRETSSAGLGIRGGTYTTTIDPTQVKLITIRIVTADEEGASPGSPGDQHAVMESTVTLRETLS